MTAIDAFGTVWALHDGTTALPAGFSDVADVTNIDVLDVEVDTIDATTHDSASQWREFIGGLKDAGELSMEINYDPAVHGTIFSALGETRHQKITLTDSGAASVEFDAILSGFSAEAPYDDKLSATVTLKVTGAVTITP